MVIIKQISTRQKEKLSTTFTIFNSMIEKKVSPDKLDALFSLKQNLERSIVQCYILSCCLLLIVTRCFQKLFQRKKCTLFLGGLYLAIEQIIVNVLKEKGPVRAFGTLNIPGTRALTEGLGVRIPNVSVGHL
jgi:hypothetical protein